MARNDNGFALDATVDFEASGSNRIVTLTNTSTGHVSVTSNLLTALAVWGLFLMGGAVAMRRRVR